MVSNIFDQNFLYPCNGHANVPCFVFGHDLFKELHVVIFSLLEVLILVDTTCEHLNESYHKHNIVQL